jgi:hypothetical protein
MTQRTDVVRSILGTDNFAEFERTILEQHIIAAEEQIVAKVQKLLQSDEFMALMRCLAQRVACHFAGWRKVKIRLSSGRRYEVISPVFLRAKPKDRRRRRYRKDVMRHFGLEYLGFHSKCSPQLIHRSVQLAALCPSFETASMVLGDLGIKMNHRLLRDLTYRVVDMTMTNRCDNVVDELWQQGGLRLLICIDGGRLRHRRRRQGRKKKGAKRHGYSTDWMAPWLLTISCVDEKGKIRRDIPPIYDGTVRDIDGAFELLTAYLKRINIKEAAAVTFCADGGNGIWERIDPLAKSLDLSQAKVHRVLDYTHAKQNLVEIVDLIHQACGIWDYQYDPVMAQMKKLLWQGRIKDIERIICTRLHRKRQKRKALKKLNDYFGDHEKFQYQKYQSIGIPIGSGTVESAIRRVINLRIKGPGIFWILENAEKMIFLRSQALTGRWHSVLERSLNRRRNHFYNNNLRTEKMAA